ncbi:glutathione S-transferase family protein [Pontibacterium granulatum]|uniref:glutathione S-transferase family protein n=1 Tax=Pontibacterium granulatum TaxID=2036029 RepID=UPI00249B97BA|nr:glutathione S-transferase family protein [Pontibacterium granulatum]MDI3323597.1 glutathione S-transferase family protein [Pontibacterium granulatum]
MSNLRLYDKPECPFCWKIRLALFELGVDIERIDSADPATRAQWQALTPRKTVPVLVRDERVIYESNVILEYLQDLTGQLLPKAPDARAQARLINAYSDGVIGTGLREVIFEKRGNPQAHWNMERIKRGSTQFEAALGYLADQLGDKTFFTDSYSLPECALTARFGLAEAYGVEIPERFENLRAWFSQMKARESYPATAPKHSIN